MRTEAYLSPDRVYRYWLLRVWDDRLPINCSCGVNPSTADEYADDHTIRKDIGFSARQGFGGLLKVNLSAFRSTAPKPAHSQSIGEENTAKHIRQYFERFKAKQFTAAWGKNGNYFEAQAKAILLEFPGAVCFGMNPDGTPRHTLTLSYSTQLVPFTGRAAQEPKE